MEQKSVINSNIPIHGDKGRSWDAGAAIARIKEWAGGDDIDFAKYRKAFFWVDTENADKQGGYKLPFADVFGGELRAVWRGVAAAMAAIRGARGGVDIPESDMAAVEARIRSYYKKFDETPSGKEVDMSYITAYIEKSECGDRAVGSTGIRDRHGEVVNPMGWDLKNFKKNPVLLWGHDHTIPAIGIAKNIRVDGEGKKAKLTFEPVFHELTEFAKAIKSMFDQGFLNSFSVGFQPIEVDGNTYDKNELLEISAVNVPANPDARMLAYKSLLEKGISQKTIDDLGLMKADPIKGHMKQASSMVAESMGYMEDMMDMMEEKAEDGMGSKMKKAHKVAGMAKDHIDQSINMINDHKMADLEEEIANVKSKLKDVVKGLQYLNPQGRDKDILSTRLSLSKVIARANDQLLEKKTINNHDRILLKVVKRANEKLIVDHKQELKTNGKNQRTTRKDS